jgi:hypothetical protein
VYTLVRAMLKAIHDRTTAPPLLLGTVPMASGERAASDG